MAPAFGVGSDGIVLVQESKVAQVRMRVYNPDGSEAELSGNGAREAIIHKEFHLSSADPKLVGEDKARKIGRTKYNYWTLWTLAVDGITSASTSPRASRWKRYPRPPNACQERRSARSPNW